MVCESFWFLVSVIFLFTIATNYFEENVAYAITIIVPAIMICKFLWFLVLLEVMKESPYANKYFAKQVASGKLTPKEAEILRLEAEKQEVEP